MTDKGNDRKRQKQSEIESTGEKETEGGDEVFSQVLSNKHR